MLIRSIQPNHLDDDTRQQILNNLKILRVKDESATRKYLDKIGPSLHATWHFAAALALYKFNQAQVEVTNKELQSISSAVQSNAIPGFLSSAYEEITKCIWNFSNSSSCTIL